MKLVIREEAANDLDLIHDWIEKDSPTTAVQVIRRIRAKVDLPLVPGMAEIGRPGRDAGTRELIEAPYVIVHESHPNAGEIVVLGVVPRRAGSIASSGSQACADPTATRGPAPRISGSPR